MKNRKNISAIIPVAGLSSRMKAFKPLLPLAKRSILETTLNLFKLNGITDIIVITGHRSADLENRITAMDATCIHNPDFHQGMFSSILTGVKNLKEDCDAFFVLPADIPAIRAHTVREMLRVYRSGKEKIIYPVFDGLRGHPPLISTEFKEKIENFSQGGGLRACLADFENHAMDLKVCDKGIHMDADTPEDYEAVRQKAERINVPEPCECICMLEDSSLADEAVMKHCVKVAEIAVKLCSRLEHNPPLFDIHLMEAAALLHDIARKAPDHAVKGAEILRDRGFSEVADIVLTHMDLKTTPDCPLNEKEILYFADKLVIKDQLVIDFEKRFKEKQVRYKTNAGAVEAIGARLETACIIKEKLSKSLKKDLTEVLQ
ncbi:MAG: NTP transferase domain-containing protein [Desulfobacteraceae bacterium]|nr:NTP transferase domain-containing protein [Desulfobacteraceae bacterium]